LTLDLPCNLGFVVKPRADTNTKEAEQRRRSLPIPVKVLTLMAMTP